MRFLLLVRHGQSQWNRERRIQGQAGPGLTDLGRKQAQRTAAWLAETAPDAAVVSSDLPRCVQTATPVAEALGRDLQLRPGLRERDFGDWTGRLVSEVVSEEQERFDRWREGEDVVPEVGGESSPELTERVVAELDDLVAASDPGAVTVAVTHGGPVWHGTHGFVGIPEGSLGGVANASMTELLDDEDWGRRLTAWNQVAHLPAGLHTRLRPSREARAEADGRDGR